VKIGKELKVFWISLLPLPLGLLQKPSNSWSTVKLRASSRKVLNYVQIFTPSCALKLQPNPKLNRAIYETN